MENKVIETRTSKIWLDEDGILYNIITPGAEQNLDDAVENTSTYVQITNGKQYPLFVDLRAAKSITRDARAHFAGEDTGRSASCVALMIGSPVSKVLGNLFMKLNTTVYPVKLFTSEDAAVAWLKGFIE